MEQVDIIVIGAGAAGLMAAKRLGEAGKKVLLLEARDRIGGRIYPLDAREFGYEAAGGGEFVHGDAPITTALVAEAGMHFDTGSERAWWSVRDGAAEKVEWNPMEFEDELLAALRALTEDIPVSAFLKTYFPDEKYAALRDGIIRRIEGYDAADASRASAFMLRDEMDSSDAAHQRTLREGYGPLIRFLADRCRALGGGIVLGTEVIAIEHGPDAVRVICKSGESYGAPQAVITVPPPILKTIAFTPEIPEKIRAAETLGFGGVIKVLLNFKTKWWAAKEEKFDNLFFMFSREAIPTWWTQYPEPYLTLTGWLAGPAAEKLAHHSETELVEIGLESLSHIFEVPLDELKGELVASKAVNWAADPYARGAYSYETPESDVARAELLASINEQLYFAGEAIGNAEIGGTVEAALASGIQVAEQILHTS